MPVNIINFDIISNSWRNFFKLESNEVEATGIRQVGHCNPGQVAVFFLLKLFFAKMRIAGTPYRPGHRV